MRDTWYGDDRDVVKWGTLAHLGAREGLEVLVQVPFLRLGERKCLVSENGMVAIDPMVWQFFRNPAAIKNLSSHLGREIVVLTDAFEPRSREAYCRIVVQRIRKIAQKKAVLLDPDTGLEPSRAEPEHVTAEELQHVWRVLHNDDWLVLYQHASRSKTWQADGRRRFAAVCGLRECEMFTSPGLASDVAFFAAKKKSAE